MLIVCITDEKTQHGVHGRSLVLHRNRTVSVSNPLWYNVLRWFDWKRILTNWKNYLLKKWRNGYLGLLMKMKYIQVRNGFLNNFKKSIHWTENWKSNFPPNIVIRHKRWFAWKFILGISVKKRKRDSKRKLQDWENRDVKFMVVL